MSIAARSCFESCLSNTSPVRTCLKYSEWQHKIFKATDPILDTISEVARTTDASEDTMVNITSIRTTIGVLRDVSGILHIFMGVIPALIYALKLIWDLGKGFMHGNDVTLNLFKEPQDLTYNEVAKGSLEKTLVSGAVCTKFIQSVASTFAFSVCRPILYIQSLGHVQLGKTAQSIGNAHSTLMLIKHASGTLGHGCEMGYQYAAFQREVKAGKAVHKTYDIFSKEMWKASVGLIEKGLQLLYDIAKMLRSAPPAWFRLPLTLTIASLGLYRVWLKTS